MRPPSTAATAAAVTAAAVAAVPCSPPYSDVTQSDGAGPEAGAGPACAGRRRWAARGARDTFVVGA